MQTDGIDKLANREKEGKRTRTSQFTKNKIKVKFYSRR